jgi:surface-adhesin protein E
MPVSIRPYRRLPLAYISAFWSLIMLLVLSSGLAYAEWVTVSEDKQEGRTAYVNPDAIQNGNLVKMWALLDFTTTQKREGRLYMSEQAQHEFDCAEERFRILALSKYSGNMASGNVIYSSTFDLPETTKWQPVPPGSLAQTLWGAACGKR